MCTCFLDFTCRRRKNRPQCTLEKIQNKGIGGGSLCGGRSNWNRGWCRWYTETITFSLFIQNPHISVHIEMLGWLQWTAWPTMKNVHRKVCTSWIHGQVRLPCLPACKCWLPLFFLICGRKTLHQSTTGCLSNLLQINKLLPLRANNVSPPHTKKDKLYIAYGECILNMLKILSGWRQTTSENMITIKNGVLRFLLQSDDRLLKGHLHTLIKKY